MTREEIIARANQAVTDAFEAGAKWEHKRLVEKACEWLDNINPDDYMDNGIFQIYDLICNLRKAMEE